MTSRNRTQTDSNRGDGPRLRGLPRRLVVERTAVFVLVVGLGVLALSTGLAFSQPSTPSAPATEANNSTGAPGAVFVSAISNERALLDGEIERTNLDSELARATTDEERVRIVSTGIQQVEDRVTDLESRTQNSQRTADQGSTTSQGDTGSVATRAEAINQTLDRLQAAAVSLPAAQFNAQYTNASSIEQLEGRLNALTVSETVPELTSESTENTSETDTPLPESTPTDESTTDSPSGETNSDDDDDDDDGDDGDDEGDSDNDDGSDDNADD